MKGKKLISIILVLTVFIQLFGINIFSVSAIEQNNIDKLVEIAKNEVGYFETTYSDGSFYSKYGDWYGYPNEPWCAMFVSWCANKAGISSSVIPKFSSCNKGREWFVNKCLWRTKDAYTPKSGDIIFLNNCTHVGIVEKYIDGTVFTVEGNSSDESGENFGVRQKMYSLESNKITGFGIPDLNILGTFNGVANKKSPAYMLPDNTSQTVWEVWQDDELEVLCSNGNYYLVMYPFLSTGKFVCAYVDRSAVTISGNIPTYKEFFEINKIGKTLNQTNLYHNPSNSSLLSNNGEDKSIRAVLNKNADVKVLFEKDGYFFVESDGITGFASPNNIELVTTKVSNLGDLNFDGNINISDVTLIQKHLSGLELLNATQITNADVDSNNKITIDDATIIQKYIAGFISDFPTKVQETTEPTSSTNIEAQSITIDNTNPNILNNGDTFKLNATVYPADTTDKSVVWSSSNPDVASVDDNGLVTAKTAGTVTITANCVNTVINATATIRVNQFTSYIGNGSYCLKLKGTSSYLDHQGGNSNGTNVHLWSGDGNSNPNQKIKIERIDDNRYMLKSAVNNDLLLDVNRGNSYSEPISIGKNIDIWQNNDWEAQEWLFTKTYDGYYIIRLNMYQGGAIEASGKNNGDNIFFGTYNPDNDMQKWELINTSEYVEPETNGWVYNTQDIGNVHVRSGPGTNYPSIGGFNEGQQITIIGSLNGDWYKVRGANRHDGNIITGYCHRDYITPVPPTPDDKTLGEGTFSNIVSNIGKQTDYRYSDSTIMCSAYCVSYVRAYLFNDYRQPTSYWGAGGAQWAASGGTWRTGNVLSIAKDNINAGKPVIIHVNWSGYTHYVVAIGYKNSGNTISDYTVVDPYYGQIVNMSKFSLYGDNQVITY